MNYLQQKLLPQLSLRLLLSGRRSVHSAMATALAQQDDIQVEDIPGKTLDIQVNEPLKLQELFDALNEPVKQPPTPEEARKNLKLSPNYLRKLQVIFEGEGDGQSKIPDRSQVLKNDFDMRKPNLLNITELVHINGKTNRPAEAQQAFDMLAELGIEPDIVAFNNLMDVYATMGDLEKCLKVFKDIKSNDKLKPDLVSYSTLIKVCVANSDIDAAFTLYTDMKKREIWPNLLIFNMLIQGCLKTNQTERAWKVFQHLKSEVERPDSICYSLMLSACARNHEAERALDLFQEMASYGVPVNTQVYNNLIRACGLRPDYYEEAFSLLEQMVHSGFEPNTYTYRTLTEIVAANKDLPRARMIWNDWSQRIHPDALLPPDGYCIAPPLKPDTIVFSQMLRMYTLVIRDVQRNVIISEKEGSSAIAETTKPALPEDEGPAFPKPNLTPVTSVKRVLPLLESKSFDLDILRMEAELMWSLVLEFSQANHIQFTRELWLRRLEFICLNDSKEDIEKSLAFLDTAASHNISLSLKAFKTVMRQICFSKHFLEFSDSFWGKFMDWDTQLETRMVEGAATPLSIKEKEDIRAKTNRTRIHMQECFLLYAKAQAINEDLDAAVKTLQSAKDFREPYYLPPITIKAIGPILEAAQRNAEMGQLDHLKAIEELCPPISTDPLADVRAVLRSKTVPSKWWGWKVMGVTEEQKVQMMRKTERENDRVEQRHGGLKRKAAIHQKNKAIKPQVFRGYIPE